MERDCESGLIPQATPTAAQIPVQRLAQGEQKCHAGPGGFRVKKQIAIQHEQGQHRSLPDWGVQGWMVGNPQIAAEPDQMQAHRSGDS